MSVNWLKIQWIRYEKSKPYSIQYKYTIQDMVQFDTIDITPTGRKERPVQFKNVPMQKLYSRMRPVSEQKKQDMIDLLEFIPPVHHRFFQNIATAANNEEEAHFHHTFYYIEVDLTYILSNSAGYGLILSYLLRVHDGVQLYLGISDFTKFGKPRDFDRVNAKYNRYSKFQYCYLQFMILGAVIGSTAFRGQECEQLNEERHTDEVCGLFAYTWMPFNINYFPVKQVFTVVQCLCIYYIYMTTGLGAWMVLESVEHIVVRMRHLSFLFEDALNQEDARTRREKFNFAVRYHVSLLSLEEKLNETFTVFMFTHVSMTGPIMGYGVYAFMKGRSYSSLLVALGWSIGLLFDCHSGQRLQNEGELLAKSLFQTNWVNCEEDLKKDFLFVIMRCQRPSVLKAASFGVMDLPMFLGVLKVSYSYITLMSNNN
ncbi:uncharacterized protein [Diabrotica undecimpunctata]|uniref:uncharacterized protein n=1 Tax=Diabrotica undecimpunctata TaxID=50387 RepID=UPI003B634581